jgi:glucose/arabinose dehydrogenase
MHQRCYPRGAAASAALLLALLALSCDDSATDLQEPEPVVEVVVSAPTSELEVGEIVQLTAAPRAADGGVLEGRTVEWATGDANVATVSESGVVTAAGEGATEISATVDEVTGTLAITVSPPQTPPPEPGDVRLQRIASGLTVPLYLTSPPDDSRLFVLEKGGTIRLVADGALLAAPFLDLSNRVSDGPEQGLLGLAFPADYATNGWFVVHYTGLDNDSYISVFRVSDDPGRADPESEAVLLQVERPSRFHNGGQLQFGPDGRLYVGLGDGGSREGDDDGRGQSLDDLLGAILRLDVSSGAGYIVPDDNPFVDTPGARPEIWSYGLRNPWRFSFDRLTGDLYIGDVGESRWEEVNRATAAAGTGRGVNYGWSQMEGPDCVVDGCEPARFTAPLVQYDHDEGCSITGGYVYRGSALPSLQGQYFFGDFCRGWVRSISTGGDSGEPLEWPQLAPGGDNITSFGEDASGEIYILTAGGDVFKVVPS